MKVYKNTKALFAELIDEFEKKLGITLSEYSKIYLMSFLEKLAESYEHFYILAIDEKPLIEILLEALHKDLFKKITELKLVGDICLLFSGLYPDYTSNKIIDIDYYINIGRSSYSFIANTYRNLKSKEDLYTLYLKLTEEFQSLTSILTEISDEINLLNKNNIYNILNRWNKTGIKKYSEILKNNKIIPFPN
ncbi:MAG: hypothetical protein SVN78_07185 [Deferribacterota bacterium]|nr:hypothetical protein [Deferribacterota bacterium]